MQSAEWLRRLGDRYGVDFDHHSRPCQRIDVEERVHRLRSPCERLRAALSRFGQISNVGHVGDDLHWYRDRCDEAGLPQCSAHGLRKLAATRLAEVGCSEREIMAITGHRSVSEVSRYTKAAEQSRLAERAIAKLTSAVAATRTEQDEKLSSAPDPLDKTTSN